MTDALDTFVFLDRLSRKRALTEQESHLLERSMRDAGQIPGSEKRARRKPGPPKKVREPLVPVDLPHEEKTRIVVEALAEGKSFSEAGRLIGVSKVSAFKRFRRATEGLWG